MKKPTDKRIKECLKDINNNFKELIDSIIYYEKKDMDDWASEIIGEIQMLSSEKVLTLLFNDINNRIDTDFDVYSYQRLWWSLINTKKENIITDIINYINDSDNGKFLKNKLNKWYLEFDDNMSTKINIGNILGIDKGNKIKP